MSIEQRKNGKVIDASWFNAISEKLDEIEDEVSSLEDEIKEEIKNPTVETIVVTELDSSPSLPDEGFVKVYAKADKKIYTLDSTGSESELGSGGGSGGSGGSAFNPPPAFQRITSGSGTVNKMYAFEIESGSATEGDTYENNSETFTVHRTVENSTLVYMSGAGAPSSSGVLTKTSGSGDSTLNFSEVKAARSLIVEMVGGGAGGNGSGTSNSGGRGAAGGDTELGTSLITAGGAPQPPQPAGGNYNGGSGGTYTIGDGVIVICAFNGSPGQSGQHNPGTSSTLVGGMGGSSPYGGGGRSANLGAGTAAVANTGSGGGGAGTSSVSSSGSGAGGGSGAFVKAMIPEVEDSYPFSVGSGGTGGSAGTSGFSGGAGADGQIILQFNF